jgi:hypothetical protein
MHHRDPLQGDLAVAGASGSVRRPVFGSNPYLTGHSKKSANFTASPETAVRTSLLSLRKASS